MADQVEIFSIQMLHQKLTFSVGGLFTLDPAFLQAVIIFIINSLKVSLYILA